MSGQDVDNAIGGFKNETPLGGVGDASIRKDEGSLCHHKPALNTPPTQTDETREAFEAWHKSRIDYNMIRHDDAFASGYKAATAAAEARYLPVVEKLVEALEQMEGDMEPLRLRDEALDLAAPLLKGEK